jgi:hypothetical protein
VAEPAAVPDPLDTVEACLRSVGLWVANIAEPSAAVEAGVTEALAAVAVLRAARQPTPAMATALAKIAAVHDYCDRWPGHARHAQPTVTLTLAEADALAARQPDNTLRDALTVLRQILGRPISQRHHNDEGDLVAITVRLPWEVAEAARAVLSSVGAGGST